MFVTHCFVTELAERDLSRVRLALWAILPADSYIGVSAAVPTRVEIF